MSTKRSTTGFWPRTNPRPSYPGVSEWIAHSLFAMFVAATKCTILTFLLQPVYHWVLDQFRQHAISNQLGLTLLLNLSHTIPYVLINGSFYLFDVFGLFQQYKMPRQEYMIPPAKLKLRTLLQASFSQLFIAPTATYFLVGYFVGNSIELDVPLPPLPTMFVHYIIAYEFNEWGFYFAHRLFHIPFLYQYIHKQHHEYVGTVSFAAEFASPIEQVFANIGPTLGGIILVSNNPLCVCIWLMMRLHQTYETHSGFCFKDTIWEKLGITHGSWAAHHDYHHSKNCGNFGSFTCDWLCGTMDSYIVSGGVDAYVKPAQD